MSDVKFLDEFNVGDVVTMSSDYNFSISGLKKGDAGKIITIHSKFTASIEWNNDDVNFRVYHYKKGMLRLLEANNTQPKQILYHGMFSSVGKNIPNDLLK